MVRNRTEHLLVIRLSAMGDVAMTVPVLLALTRTYPKLRITVLTRGFFTPMFLNIPNTTVYEADVKGVHRGLSGIWRLSRELRNHHFTAVADLHNVLRSTLLKILFLGKGIPFVQIDKGRKEKKKLTLWKIKTIEPLMTTHERYAAVFKKLGYPVALMQSDTLPKITPTKRIQELLGEGYKKVIGIAPYAAFKGKMYPLSLMKELLQLLDNSNKYMIILLGGGPREAKELNELAGRYASCINGAGFLSFSEELMLISNLDLVLSMDSGNAHLAAMFGVPTITLWGVTHPYAGFYPFQQDPRNAFLADREQFPFIPTSVYGNKLPKGYERAMDTIDPYAILLRVEEVLGP